MKIDDLTRRFGKPTTTTTTTTEAGIQMAAHRKSCAALKSENWNYHGAIEILDLTNIQKVGYCSLGFENVGYFVIGGTESC